MRLFVAADLPGTVRDALAAEQARIESRLRPSGALRWVKPEHAHLTIVFIGEVDDRRVPAVVEAVGRDVDAEPIDAVFGGAGVFPPRGAPRVLWIGLADGARALGVLQQTFAARVTALGLPLEERRFHPHLTLARWRDARSADGARALAAASAGVVARARIASVTLYQSRLSPSGPTYTALARANLTRQPT